MSTRAKRILIIAAASILLLVAAGFVFLRKEVLKAPDFKPDPKKADSPVDLGPAIIARLQQLVKDGSDGLYHLSIGNVDVEVVDARIAATDVSLQVDSAGYRRMNGAKDLPDDIFALKLDRMEIHGLGIDELLHTRDISIDKMLFIMPEVSVWHQLRDYNKNKKSPDPYEKLKKHLDRLSIGRIELDAARFTDHNQPKGKKMIVTRVKDISIRFADILIDESTRDGKDRFLFAKSARFETKDFSIRTPDSLYNFGISNIAISAEKHLLVADGLSLKPRLSRDAFSRRQKEQTELYTVNIPRITLKGINWWTLFHLEEFKAEEATIGGGTASIYLDQRVPSSGKIKPDNFPQQMLMQMEAPVALRRLRLEGLSVIYDELNALSGQLGTISFNSITGTVGNCTNDPAAVAKDPVLSFNGSCRFMNKVPLSGDFSFWLPKSRKGAFTADLKMGTMDNTVVNPFSGPMGMVVFPTGQMQKASASISGDNAIVRGTVEALYSDLHIDVLKKGGEKKLVSKIANVFMVKDNNPNRRGEIRRPAIEHTRTTEGSFFNFAWMGIKKGILKTIGVPTKLGM